MGGGEDDPSPKGVPPESDAHIRLEDRPPMVRAATWASRITSVSLTMVVPGLIGYWVDLQLGILPVLMIAGFVLGLAGGMFQLIKMTSPSKRG